MKDFFDKWEKELDSKMPKLRQDIIDEPIPQKKIKTVEFKKKKPIFKHLSVICSIAAVIVLCICIIPLINQQDTASPSGGKAPTVVQEDRTLLTVEINPRVVIISTKEGIVTKVVATNKDADVILSIDGFDSLVIGKPTSEALVNYVELATKLGYIDADANDNAVKITSLESEKDLAALAEVKAGLEAHFKSKGIYAVVVDKSVSIDKICEINEIEKTDKIENVIKGFVDRSPLYGKNELDSLPSEGIEEYYKSYVANGLTDEVERVLDIGTTTLNTWELYWRLFAWFGDYWTVTGQEEIMELLPPEYKEMAEQIGENLSCLRDCGIAIESIIELEKCCRCFWNNGVALGNMEQLRKELDELHKAENYGKYKKLFEELNFDSTVFDKLEVESVTKEDVEKAQNDLLKEEGANRIESNKDGYGKEREEIDDERYDRYLEEIKNQYGGVDGLWNEKHQKNKK